MTKRAIIVLALCGFLPSLAHAQQFGPELYGEMQWRMIGPFRGGRTVGATGVPGHPGLFYIGVNNGGVWKTDDFGRTWWPIFDDQPTGSIGALALAPSNPSIIYVGTGEGLQRPDLSTGDGVYKSTDAGKTWRHMGLGDAQQIGAVIIDPRDPNRVFVAVLGHPYGPNAERGVYRSTDGGEHWDRVLYKDENTGAEALAFDPSNPQIVYADLWASRQGPWENGSWQGEGSGLFKSTDGGTNWTQLTGGLPGIKDGLGRIGFSVAPSDPNRLYAMVEASPKSGGVYRTDDAGQTWQRVNNEQRIWGRGSDFAEVKVDPKNRDIIYVANTSTYRSTDAGQNFVAWKGAPGGDDYHTVWISPDSSDTVLIASDQGAVITVNGGRTWSSWYNQPTAQMYHVITDNQFPYMVYSGQQESGSAGVSSRGNDGQITFRDWHPVGADEYGYVAPDPLNPNVIYGGRVERFDRTTGQVQNVGPEAIRSGKYRFLRTQPLLFSPVDPHILYFAGNVLFKTTSGGHTWDVISPDLSRETAEIPESVGVYRPAELAKKAQRRGVIYAVGPSYVDVNTIWAGTDDGLIHVTRDGGKNWTNVTPPDMNAWSKVAQLDAGRFDKETAYAAVNRIRLDDQRPHIYRTHDGGKTWQQIVRGLPDNAPINTVREDPVRKGLLFAGSERAVYFSVDDGDNWLPLRLNMPATSIRDLVIHNDDLVVGTHGRAFWILDDITPLRQLSQQVATSSAYLFQPEVAYRIKRDTNTDTPIPPDEPAGKNPPDGAIIDYYLGSAPASNFPVMLEIYDSAGSLVRRYSSSDKPEEVDPKRLAVPTYWIRPYQPLSAAPGMHRFVWDLHYPRPKDIPPSFPISAVHRDTPAEPMGPAVMPGEYTIRLIGGNHRLERRLTVKEDPRVTTPLEALRQQFDLSMKSYQGLARIHDAMDEAHKIRGALRAAAQNAEGESKKAFAEFSKQLSEITGEPEEDIDILYFAANRAQRGRESLGGIQSQLVFLLALLQSADNPPTATMAAGVAETEASLSSLLERWAKLKQSAPTGMQNR